MPQLETEPTAPDRASGRAAGRISRKHKAIVEAALACAIRDGVQATSVDAIAAQAGVGKQTIYRWWPSKAALYVDVYSEIVGKDVLMPDPGPLTTRLAAFLSKLFRLYRETPAGRILAGLVAAATSDPETRRALQEGLVLGRAELVEGLVGEAVADGTFGGDPAIANEIVVAVVWKRLVMAPDSLDDAFARTLADLALSAAASSPYRTGAAP
ncbi:TetR/AcrR family transcriptional regulator [Amorphus sp. 3PC139-8]|uniref:TetR/AcrR family transcriptional regulator n=1 Tax=Amorphus sp. 3PC139-8 TaxID=2735676 RepID=UPI00345C7E3A